MTSLRLPERLVATLMSWRLLTARVCSESDQFSFQTFASAHRDVSNQVRPY